MRPSTLEKQLASVAEGRSNLAEVRTPRGNIVILSERLGQRFRPVLEYMAQQVSVESTPAADSGWTDAKNSRRMELIDKKYNGALTTAEKRELKALQAEGEQAVDRLMAPQNEMLELVLLGLQQKAARQKAAS